MLVDTLSDNRGVDRCRVSLIANGLLVLVQSLAAVSGSVLFWNILLNVTRYRWCFVLVVGMMLLLVQNGLDLCGGGQSQYNISKAAMLMQCEVGKRVATNQLGKSE